MVHDSHMSDSAQTGIVYGKQIPGLRSNRILTTWFVLPDHFVFREPGCCPSIGTRSRDTCLLKYPFDKSAAPSISVGETYRGHVFADARTTVVTFGLSHACFGDVNFLKPFSVELLCFGGL